MLTARPGFGSRTWIPVLTLAVAFGVYLTIWHDGPITTNDTRSYLEAARDLEDFDFDRPHLRSVGYPLLLRLTSGSSNPGLPLVALQLLLHFVALAGLALLLSRLGTSFSLILLFIAAGSLPHIVQGAGMVLSESLTGSLLAFAITSFGLALTSPGRVYPGLVLSGFFLAACGAVRPVYLAVPLALGTGLILLGLFGVPQTRRRATRSAIALAAPTLLFLVLGAIADRTQPRASSSPLLEFALLAKTAHYVEALPDEQAEVRAILVKHRDRELLENHRHRAEGFIFDAWDEILELEGDDRGAAKEALRQAATWLVIHKPTQFLRLTWNSTARYWSWYSSGVPGLRHAASKVLSTFVHFSTVAIFACSLAFFAIGLLLSRALRPPARRELARALAVDSATGKILLATLLTVLLAALLQTTLGVGAPRYRLPTDPLILFLAVVAVDRYFRLRGLVAERSWE